MLRNHLSFRFSFEANGLALEWDQCSDVQEAKVNFSDLKFLKILKQSCKYEVKWNTELQQNCVLPKKDVFSHLWTNEK